MATLNELVERARTAYHKTSAAYFWSGLFTFLLGIPFLIFGLFAVSSGPRGQWGYLLLVIGILFAGWGVSQFVSARRMNRK